MFLKELYISGFKSFANPVTLEFDPGVSAIVGPNGSGKSNISDAIRFVLGEQRTKQLRSHKLEDIIFSGTDSENPRGAAEIRLVIQQEDETYLTVSRKYFRTGESKYFLNGKRVRLKDILSTFNDTGLGKNGYSIVSQGGVDNIVGASSQVLRELVEEAIGIAGYKFKRNETELRLKSTKDNIERIKDILDEINKQLKPLKRQAEKTRRYLEINEILQVIDLVSFYDKQTANNEIIEKNKIFINQSTTTLKNIDEKSQKIDNQFITLNKDLIQLRQNYSSINSQILNDQEILRDFNSKKSSKEAELLILEKEIEHLSNNLASLKQNTQTINSKIKDNFLKREDLEKNLKIKKNHLEKNKEALETYKLKLKTLEYQKSEFERIQNELKVLNEIQVSNYKELDEIERNLKRLQEENNIVENNFESTKTDISQKKQLIEKIRKDLEAVETDLNNRRERINDLDKKHLELFKQIQIIQSELSTTTTQLQFQLQQKNSYSGFQHSVKTVMYSAKQDRRVFGPIANLFNVDNAYALAIQTALEGRAQNIVVSDENVAQEYIELLKREKRGRATFLPISSIREITIPENELTKMKTVEGFINTASEIIKTKPEFKKVFSSLLGRVIVIKDFNSARNFRRIFNKYTIVTLEGEIFYPGGAIVGGSSGRENQSPLFYNLELKKLNKRKKELEENLSKKNKEDTLNNQSLEEEQNYLKECENLKSKYTLELESLQKRVEELKDLSSNYELSANKDKIKIFEDNKENLERKIAKNKEKILNLKEENHNLDSGNFVRNTYENLLNETTELKVDISTLEANLRNENEKETVFKSELDKNQNSILSVQKQIDTLIVRKKETKDKVSDIILKIEDLEKSIVQSKTNYENIHASINQKESLKNQAERELKDLNQQRITETENKNALERKNDKLLLESKNQKQFIFSQYGKNYAMIKDDIDYLRRKKKDLNEFEIKELRKELIKLGSVNTDAIEEYNALEERYKALNIQYEDMIKAEKDIQNTIKMLNHTMIRQFSDKFEVLNKTFKKIFTSLFEGGSAELRFTNPDDLLNSGIELVAQPPGKKLKSLSLLSGGEKAMTAISLLFSFIELNPAPFTIIDEIDAALDDSNINRFTRYLKYISSQNQFVIITHRKNTLKICDKINGVTMASDGISRLCTLELKDYELME